MNIDLAIIIPTLNEEHFIGRLLDSIADQTVQPRQLVVVDASSKDKTIWEIKKRQKKLPALRYFSVPKSTISAQRNFGVKKTSSPNLLFLDADMMFKGKDTLERYFEEILKRKPDAAAAGNLPDTHYWKDAIYFQFENLFNKLIKFFWPGSTARNLYIRREIFESIGGFDENIVVGEDYELVQRIVKHKGKFILLEGIKLYTSTRRLREEGRGRFILKVIIFGFKILFYGYRKATVRYEFGHFKPRA